MPPSGHPTLKAFLQKKKKISLPYYTVKPKFPNRHLKYLKCDWTSMHSSGACSLLYGCSQEKKNETQTQKHKKQACKDPEKKSKGSWWQPIKKVGSANQKAPASLQQSLCQTGVLWLQLKGVQKQQPISGVGAMTEKNLLASRKNWVGWFQLKESGKYPLNPSPSPGGS